MAYDPKCFKCGKRRACDGICWRCKDQERRERIEEKERTHWWIGRPPEWDLIEKSYTELVYGRREPKYGRVSQWTFDRIRYSYTMNPEPPPGWTIKIYNAVLIVDPLIATGYVKWAYEWEGPVPEEQKREKTIQEVLAEESKRLGQEALTKILNQCTCEICRVMRMVERPFG